MAKVKRPHIGVSSVLLCFQCQQVNLPLQLLVGFPQWIALSDCILVNL